FYDAAARRSLHSFPTRRSSDLVDLEQIARTTPGMTGADLANLVNEAAILAARRGLEIVGTREFGDALEKVQLGTARSVVLPEAEDRKSTRLNSSHVKISYAVFC